MLAGRAGAYRDERPRPDDRLEMTMVLAIHPLADRVVLRPLEEHRQERGGLLHPATAKEEPRHGEVVAVGPGRYEKGVRVPMELSIGQEVLYDRYSGREVTVDDERYLIIEEPEVLARVSD